MDATRSLKVVDLFAGCGGLSLGLEQAGFFPVFVNELNSDARATYIRNRVDINPLLADPAFHEADVKKMVATQKYIEQLNKRLKSTFSIEKGELDLVVGGPPCQGFSGIGHRRSYSVEKEQLPSNHLYQDMAVVIHRLQPRAFVFENVRGLLNAKWSAAGQKGEAWEDVFETFRLVPGYQIAFQLVFAKDYGVPQNRPRVLLVGLRDDVVNDKIIADLGEESRARGDAVKRGFLPAGDQGRPPDLVDLIGDLIDPDFANGGVTTHYPAAASSKIQKELRVPHRGGEPVPAGSMVSEQDYSKHSPHVIEKFQLLIAGREIPDALKTKKFAQRALPKRWGPDGPTITATSLPDDYVHFCQPRILTVREWARLQTFPDWYEFSGSKTTGGLRRAGNPRAGVFDREVPKYTQIGNAVPVKLGKAVGLHLSTILSS